MEEDETPMATVMSGGTRSAHQQQHQQQQQQQQAGDGNGQGRRERRANRQAAHLHQREREFTGKLKTSKVIDTGLPFDVVFLDFAKSFGKVPRERPLEKLRAYKVRSRVLNWIRNWLTGRRYPSE
jgi:hypothetical protein